MRNKSIQNTNIQTNTKVQRKDDRQFTLNLLRGFYGLTGRVGLTYCNWLLLRVLSTAGRRICNVSKLFTINGGIIAHADPAMQVVL